jgi:S-adenosylmethionine:tRNA ribosyltransferase-isomerase
VHLDVGLGTFLPVKTENVLEHKMHSESFFLTKETAEALNRAKKMGKRIIAVGTTSVRVLESCADESGRLCSQSGETNIFIYPGYKFKFVDAMFTNFHTPKSTLLMLVSAFAEQNIVIPAQASRLAGQLNNRAKHSILGRDLILKAYEEAKQKDYRFYSFGDAMIIV